MNLPRSSSLIYRWKDFVEPFSYMKKIWSYDKGLSSYRRFKLLLKSASKGFLMRKCRYLLYFLSECSRVWTRWKWFLIFYRLKWSNRKWRHLFLKWSVFWFFIFFYFFLFRNIVIDSCWPEYWQSFKRHCNARLPRAIFRLVISPSLSDISSDQVYEQ